MLRNVFLKTLHEQRRGLLGWLASIVGFIDKMPG